MASNVTVAYLADVTDLRTKSALAKSALTDVNASVREQAAAFAELSDEAKGPALAALQALTAEQAKLKEVIAAVTAEQKRSSSEAEHNAGVFSKLHETVKLTGESFESMTASVRVWTSAASAIGEFALAGLGIERITESVGKWTEAAEAMQKLSEATGLTTDQLYGLQYVAKMTATPFEDVQSAVAKLARALEEAAESADSKAGRALAAMGINTDAAAFKTATFGEKLDLITGKLSSYESGQNKSNLEMALFGRTGENLTAVLNELGRDGLDAASDKAKQLGLSLTGPASQAAIEYQDHVKNLTSEWQSFVNTVMGRVVPALDAIAQHYGIGTSLDQDIDRVKQKIAEISAGDSTDHPAAFLFPWVKSSELGDLNKQLDGLLAKKAQLERDTAQHNQATFGSPNAPAPGSQKAPDFSDKSGEQIDQWKDQLLQMQVVDGKFHAMSAAQEAAFWQTKIGLTKAGTTEQREVLEQFEEASRRAQTEGTKAIKKSAEEEFEAYKGGIDQQLAAARDNYPLKISLLQQEVDEAKRLFGEKSRAAIEAETKIAEAQEQQKEAAIKSLEAQMEATKNLQRAMADLAAAGSKSDVGEFKPSMSIVFGTTDVHAEVAAQVARLREALDDELAGLQKEIQGRLDIAKSLAPGSDAFNDQMKTVTADFATMAEANKNFTDQAVALNERAAQAVTQSWSVITSPIASAFDKIVDGALSGHQRIAVTAEQAAASMVASWTKAAINSLAQWVLSEVGITSASTAGEATRTALSTSAESVRLAQIQAEISAYLASEGIKTSATTAGTAARVAAGQTENAGFLSRVFTSVAQWLGLETAKTAATTAGSAARTTAEATSAAAGRGAEAAINAATIQSDAAVAAAGAYAATAPIPFVGPALAPGAAAAAYGEVSSFQAAAAAEGGWDRVPSDGVVTELHKDEMVLPRDLAEGVRRMSTASASKGPALASASGAGGNSSVQNNTGGNIGAIHYSPTFHGAPVGSSADMASLLRSDKRAFASAINEIHLSSYANGGLTLPGRKPWR